MGCFVVLLFNKTVNLVLSTGIQSKACTTGLRFVHCRWVVLLFCCLTRQSTQFYQQVYKARPVPLGYASSTVDGLFCCFVVLLFCCLTRQSTQFYQQVYKARPVPLGYASSTVDGLFCCLTRQSTQFYQQVYKARPVPLGQASSTVDGLFCCFVVLLFNKTVNLVLSTGIQSKACTTGLGFIHCRWVVLLFCCFVVLLFCCFVVLLFCCLNKIVNLVFLNRYTKQGLYHWARLHPLQMG